MRPRVSPTNTAAPYMILDAQPHRAKSSGLDDKVLDAAVATASKAWDAQR